MQKLAEGKLGSGRLVTQGTRRGGGGAGKIRACEQGSRMAIFPSWSQWLRHLQGCCFAVRRNATLGCSPLQVSVPKNAWQAVIK